MESILGTEETLMDKPSIEFLDELRRRAKAYGWSGDYVEVLKFVQRLYKEAGIDYEELDFEVDD